MAPPDTARCSRSRNWQSAPTSASRCGACPAAPAPRSARERCPARPARRRRAPRAPARSTVPMPQRMRPTACCPCHLAAGRRRSGTSPQAAASRCAGPPQAARRWRRRGGAELPWRWRRCRSSPRALIPPPSRARQRPRPAPGTPHQLPPPRTPHGPRGGRSAHSVEPRLQTSGRSNTGTLAPARRPGCPMTKVAVQPRYPRRLHQVALIAAAAAGPRRQNARLSEAACTM
mmetsp:Transcript_108200/g.344941  ORF Transcript_108200/g.344941 Transcript_108200/m.344941 type:complete len:231 (+) Transcript_108200:482-1174(+)